MASKSVRIDDLRVLNLLRQLDCLSINTNGRLRVAAEEAVVSAVTDLTRLQYLGTSAANQIASLELFESVSEICYNQSFRNRLAAPLVPSSLVDLPAQQMLTATPIATAAGVCSCNYKGGYNATHSRHMYFLFSRTNFWRYDTFANCWQQLASPPGGTVGNGTCLSYDPSKGTLGSVWALIANATAPTWQFYDIATNAWTARAITNLPATFGTDGCLSHTCTTYNAGGNDDFIYLIGNNAAIMYRYTIGGNTWVASPTTIASCPSTSETGCSLAWAANWDVRHLLRFRGGATATVDYYDIVDNNWTALTFHPATETFTTGSTVAHDLTTKVVYITKENTGRVYKLDLTAAPGAPATLTPVATINKFTNQTATTGDKFLHTESADGIGYLYYGQHTGTHWFRIPLFAGIA